MNEIGRFATPLTVRGPGIRIEVMPAVEHQETESANAARWWNDSRVVRYRPPVSLSPDRSGRRPGGVGHREQRVAPGRDLGRGRSIAELVEEAVGQLVRQPRLRGVADELMRRALVEVHAVDQTLRFIGAPGPQS